jgi:hypothetical protein
MADRASISALVRFVTTDHTVGCNEAAEPGTDQRQTNMGEGGADKKP